ELAVRTVLQVEHEIALGLLRLDAVVADVALVLQDLGDVHLQLRGRHADALRVPHVGVADARQEVGYGVGHRHGELLLLTRKPCACRGSRPAGPSCADRSGRCRTCDTRPADGHTGCSAARRANGTSASAWP